MVATRTDVFVMMPIANFESIYRRRSTNTISVTMHQAAGRLGATYLSRTVALRFFPALWAVRGRFFGAERSP